MRKSGIEYSRDLNPGQLLAVTESDGPALVLAGAGTGKTRTLIYRVAHLIDHGVAPGRILLMTFTNKAAREMLRRVEELLGEKPEGLWGGTFHHVGNLVLREHARRLGYPHGYAILDHEDSRDLIGQCISELGLASPGRHFPKARLVQFILSFARNSCMTLEESVSRHHEGWEEFILPLKEVTELYARRKVTAAVLDFDDLLAGWYQLLRDQPDLRGAFSRRFSHVLVDEYQDTNRLQFEIMKLLLPEERNLLAVGDDAQSIYSFRAADIRNLLDFPEEFPGTRIFRLEANYRSSPEILALANHCISFNTYQYPKSLQALRPPGGKPVVVALRDARQEAAFVANQIGEFWEAGRDLGEIAVLFRARYQAAELELELARRKTPYVIRGGVRFLEQRHVKDVLAHLRVLVAARDEISWRRILLLQEGIGPGAAQTIWTSLSALEDPLTALSPEEPALKIKGRAARGWSGLRQLLQAMRGPGTKGQPARMISALMEGGYQQYLELTFPDSEDRVRDIAQLSELAAPYESAEDFLSEVLSHEEFKGEPLDTQADRTGRVVLSTIHQAKGLEWSVVLAIGMTDGAFPHPSAKADPLQMEEERRLFYVAVTRAKGDLIITYPVLRPSSTSPNYLSRPSLFIQELPASCYERWVVPDSY
jgi:DNA helicase-2/ATP-dependent DNA helicase PcrA